MIHRLLFLVLLITTTLPLAAQGRDDARRQAQIDEAQKELAVAGKKLAKANLSLQSLYSRFERASKGAQDGSATDFLKDLQAVVGPAWTEAQAAANGRKSSQKIKSGFERKFRTSLRNAKHELTVALKPLLRERAGVLVGERGRKVGDEDTASFVSALVADIFPADRDFAHVWNDHVSEKLSLVTEYTTIRDEVKKLQQKILVLEDPKLKFTIGAPEGMARIDAKNVRVVSTFGFKTKARSKKVKSFYIDLREVSHQEYWEKFYVALSDPADKANHLPRNAEGEPLWFQEPTTGEYRPEPDKVNLPVTGVDAISAMAFAQSQKKRLPTEAEWLAAASNDGRKITDYAFGSKFVKGLCNSKESGLSSPITVDELPRGRSYYGLYHCSGNVKEWVATTDGGKDHVKEIPNSATLILRGGSFLENHEGVSLKWRWIAPAANTRTKAIGFRCASDIF